MQNIFLVRHAHSVANEDFSILRTVPDRSVKLSRKGVQQAMQMGQTLLECAKKINASEIQFISSNYIRAKQTTHIMNSVCKSEMPTSISVHPLIYEKGMGKYEGYDLKDIPAIFGDMGSEFLSLFNNYDTKYTARPPDRCKSAGDIHDHHGESYADSNVRAKNFVSDEIFSQVGEEGVVTVVVSHGRFNTFIEKEIMFIDNEDLFSIPIYNNGAFKYFRRKETMGYDDMGLIFDGFENHKEYAFEKLQQRRIKL